MNITGRRIASALHLALCVAVCGIVRPISTQAEGLRMTPEEHHEKVMANPNLKVEGNITGEGFCWHGTYAADSYVTAYLASKDTAWLGQAVRYFDWLLSLMMTAPDGYRGWIGPYLGNRSLWADVHVGDAILFCPMLRFSETVLADDALRSSFGKAADRYVAEARKHLFAKWDTRGTWREDGPFGAYAGWDRFLSPEEPFEWRPRLDVRNATLSLPFNKQFDMGIAALRLHRITGESPYRERAERIFRTMKARIRHVDDYYVWNYWEPLGPWDIVPEDRTLRHWVNVHPYRDYQAGEIHNIVEAYHSGIVFDRTDIQRILNTNLKVMWNGDLESPRWRNSNATGPWGPPPPPPGGHWKGWAGTLWSALTEFDQTVRDLHERGLKPGTISHAFYEAVTSARPPGFAQQYAGPDDLRPFEFPFSPCSSLTMVAALPSVIQKGETTVLACKAPRSGELEIALYTPDGALVRVLHTAEPEGGPSGHEGITLHDWDGTDPDGQDTYGGDYRIRWTHDGEYREFPITIR